jgi:protein phosphatase
MAYNGSIGWSSIVTVKGDKNMKACTISDVGRVRENNEDAVFMDEEHGIFLLADGMGGAAGGEIASALAVGAAYDVLRGRLPRTDALSLPRLLADALASAQSALLKRSLREPDLAGMGTTLEIMVVKDREAFLCHVGDSRVYLLRNGELRQLTRDDNMASLLMEQEHLSPEAVPPQARHILTQAVGASDTLVPEIRTVEVRENDIFLICSDGLTGMLTDPEIAEILRLCRDGLDKAAATLVREANERGGFDNVSLILVEPTAPTKKILLLAHR